MLTFLTLNFLYSCSDSMIKEENDNTPKVPDALAIQKSKSNESQEETSDYEYHTNITQGSILDDLDNYAKNTPDEYAKSIEKPSTSYPKRM